MSVKMTRQDAVELFTQGAQVLSRITSNGIRIDKESLDNASKQLDEAIKEKLSSLNEYPQVKEWKRRYGMGFSFRSNDQLSDILFNYAGFDPIKTTEKGNPSVDVEVLEQLYDATHHPFIGDLIELRKLEKAKGTYLALLYRETNEDGFLHPFFRLDGVVSYRSSSCLAKGTKILTLLGRHIEYVPIENIKAGDMVVSFNDKLEPVLSKVKWAGQTGVKQCVRLKYDFAKRSSVLDNLDCTPDHKIRMIDGFYVNAVQTRDYVACSRHKNDPFKKSMLACWIDVTGTTFYIKTNRGFKQREDLFLKDNLTEKPEVHPDRVKLKYTYTRQRLLRIIASTKCKDKNFYIQLGTMRRHCKMHGIDFDFVKQRYTKDGRYIAKTKLINAIKEGKTKKNIAKILNVGTVFLDNLCAHYKVAIVDGHPKYEPYRVKHIEYWQGLVPVYDLQVETYHNFVANSICVHNSNPNFQNFPNRDPFVKNLIRGCMYPRQGQQLMELDYSGMEVRVAYCYHKDPAMRAYLMDSTKDMHRDMAKQIFILGDDEWNKQCRQAAKSHFVFPAFYGSYYKQMAQSLWNYSILNKIFTGKNGDGDYIIDHLRKHKLGTLNKFTEHVKQIEEHFWGVRFKTYNNWKIKYYKQYLKNGYFDSYTGFRYEGVFKRNDVLNYAVQGSAFHCLLKTIILLQRWLNKYKYKSVIVGQIHDSVVIDCVPSEIPGILEKVLTIVDEELPAAFSWLSIPLIMEGDLCSIDTAWSEKKAFDLRNFLENSK